MMIQTYLHYAKLAKRLDHIFVDIDEIISLKCFLPSALEDGVLKMFLDELFNVDSMHRIGEGNLWLTLAVQCQ